MKKSLIALAVMAAAGAASAQSSVTLFGIVDVAYSHYSVSGGQHSNQLTNSGYNSARLGFRGTEDLGGGLAASFWLEGALAPDNGNATGFTFQRRSTVSLSGNWGEVRLGRDYTPTFWNLTVFDPFGTNGVGTVVGFKARNTSSAAAGAASPVTFGTVGGTKIGLNDTTTTRSDNLVQYFLPPNLGGFYGQASYAFDENKNSDAGQFYGARLGFASGPFNVAGAVSHTKGGVNTANKAATTDPLTGNVVALAVPLTALPRTTDWNLGGQWDFGMAKLMAQYDHAKYTDETGLLIGTPGVSRDATLKSWLIGGLIPVGAGEIRLSYSHTKLDTDFNDPAVGQWAIGYVHNLSKRTALYATYAHLKNKDGAQMSIQNGTNPAGVVNSGSSGFDLGIRHSF